MAFTKNTINNVSSGGAGSIKIWSFINTSDTLATIMGADYFLEMRFALNQNDVIFIIGSDGSEIIRVTSLVNATSVTVVTYDAVAAGTIVNADVSATAAIVFSKMEDVTSGQLVVGSAGNVPTAVAMSGDIAIIASGATTIQAEAVETSMVVPAVSRTATLSLSAALFNAMYTTPVLIVAAGGANTLHIVSNVVYEVNYGAAQFTGGGVVAVQYDSTANGAGTDASADTAAAVFNGYTADSFVYAVGELPTGNSSTSVNKGLYISNETAVFATGDSTVEVHVTYSTVTTTV